MLGHILLCHIVLSTEGGHLKNIFDIKSFRFRLYWRCKYVSASFIPAQVARLRPREAGARPQRLRQDSAKAGRGGHSKGEMRRKTGKKYSFL